MRFTKIRFNKKEGKTILEFQKKNRKDEWDDFAFSCSEQPLPEFITAMQSLNIFLRDLCELPPKYIDRLSVKGVSFSYGGEKEVMGACLIGSMRLNCSYQELNLVSPFKASDSYNDNKADPKYLLPSGAIVMLKVLCDHAERYLNGERAQQYLFKQNEPEAAQNDVF